MILSTQNNTQQHTEGRSESHLYSLSVNYDVIYVISKIT